MSVSIDLAGRQAIVTGASRGIGRTVAVELARAGAKVALFARDAGRLDDVASEVEELGGAPIVRSVDIADPASIREAVTEVAKEAGGLDILVNNAGITRDNLLLRMKEEEWNDVLATNLSGTFHCLQAASRFLMKSKAGRVINLASVSAMRGNPGQANYTASKAGVIALTKSAAKELASRGVTVNAVAPGLIETDMTEAMGDEVKSSLVSNLPLGRLGAAPEVAAAVVFLASPLASYITGHVLVVDGGLAM